MLFVAIAQYPAAPCGRIARLIGCEADSDCGNPKLRATSLLRVVP